MPSTIISISAHKGGVGKSCTSMALAAGLARQKRRTLLMDLDPQGHSSLGLGIEPSDQEPTLRELFTDPPAAIQQVMRPTHISGLEIVPSNIRLERVTQALYGRPKREELLLRRLQPVRNHYDFIVLDCPPSLGVLTENAISAAGLIIVPCLMEARAADGLVDLLEVISILKGEEFSNWRILLTRVDPRKSVTNAAVQAALTPWQEHIFRTVIPQSEPLNQAQIERTDIYTFAPDSKGALAYQALTQEIANHAQ